nr:tyrosine-type recombinase/integrase [Corynebacterium resistens]
MPPKSKTVFPRPLESAKRGRASINKSVTGETKTRTTRTIAVPAVVLEELKLDLKDKLPGALVWSQRDGKPVSTPSRRSWWHSAVDECMEQDSSFPDVTPHDLRHAAASIMISGGASVLVVQRQLGHSSAKMTLDRYAHLFDADLDVISSVVDLSWKDAN